MPTTPPPSTRPTVLIVEDDAEIRAGLVDLLRSEAYDVTAVRNGHEALERLAREGPPCLVLLDLMTPVMDGWRFLEEVRRWPALKDGLSVVVLTASGSRPEGAPVREVLKKPFDTHQLLQTVAEYCGR